MATYYEDGGIFEVEVIEDNSDEEWERFTLKIVKIISNHCLNPVKVGDIIKVEKRRDAPSTGLWELG